MSTQVNEALWQLPGRHGARIAPAPYTHPGPGEIVVRVRAVALNPVDTASDLQRRMVYPWLRYPTVLGTDVAGDVVEVGDDDDRHRVGDRVLGLAVGQDRHCNSASAGAFQHFVVLKSTMTAQIPDTMAFVEAAVLPLGLATAGAGLFQPDHLGLRLPGGAEPEQSETVLIWGGTTSVGCNAIQLAHSAGYHVTSTGSPRHHAMHRALGADETFDYRDRTADWTIRNRLRNVRLAGVLAIGAGSLSRTLRIAKHLNARSHIASVYPSPITTAAGQLGRLWSIGVSGIWAGSIAHDHVGPALFTNVLPASLADGSYRSAPPYEFAGQGLAAIPPALDRLRRGVSASKIVISL